MMSLRDELQALHNRQPPRGLGVPGGNELEEAYHTWREEVLDVEQKIMRLGHGLDDNGTPARAGTGSSSFERYPKLDKALAMRLGSEICETQQGQEKKHTRKS